MRPQSRPRYGVPQRGGTAADTLQGGTCCTPPSPRAFPGEAGKTSKTRVAAIPLQQEAGGGQVFKPPAILTIVSGGKVGAGRTPAAVLRWNPHVPEGQRPAPLRAQAIRAVRHGAAGRLSRRPVRAPRCGRLGRRAQSYRACPRPTKAGHGVAQRSFVDQQI